MSARRGGPDLHLIFRRNNSERGPAQARPGRSTAVLALALAVWLGTFTAPRASAAGSPRFLVLAPTESVIADPADLVIAIAIIDPDRQVDPATVSLWLDGREVTASAQVTAGAVTWVPPEPLPPGSHRFELRGRTLTGTELIPIQHDFRGGPETAERAIRETRGQLTLFTLSDDLAGPGRRLRQEPERTSTARLTMSTRWDQWKIDARLFLTSDEEQGFQPRNRYAVEIDRGWIGVGAGDLNYRFSPLVLQGKRTRGLGGRLRYGAAELTAISGTIRRGVEGSIRITPAVFDTNLVRLVHSDSVQALSDTTVLGGSFERKLIGARLAFGRGRTFQFGLDGLRVRDEVGSIRKGLMPKDNLVVGGNVLVAPSGRRVVAEAIWAWSALSEDITGGALSDSLLEERLGGSYPDFRDYDRYFIVNYSTTPIDPRQLSSLAWETTVRGDFAGHSYRVGYRRTGTAFRNLAATSLRSDQAGVRLTDTFRAWQRRLELSGEFEGFADNLSKDKLHTTDTRIWGASAAFLPGRPDLRSVTLGVRQYHRENDAAAPSPGDLDFRRDETTTSITVGAGYNLLLGSGHEFALGFARVRTDALERTADAVRSDWRVGWSTRFSRVPVSLKAGVAGSRAEYSATGAELDYYHYDLGVNYRFLDGRLHTSASAGLLAGEGSQGLSGGDKTSLSAAAVYLLRDGTSITGRIGRSSFRGDADPAQDYDETMVSLRLVQDFSL